MSSVFQPPPFNLSVYSKQRRRRVSPRSVASGTASLTLGLVTETDSAFSLSENKTLVLGQPAELDTAFSLTRSKALALGLALSTEQALALSGTKSRALGLTAETDTAHALVPQKVRVLGLPVSTETALALLFSKAKTLGLPVEIQVVFPLVPVGGVVFVLGLITEIDTARPISATKSKAFGLTSETDTALAIGRARSRSLGLVNEADATFALASLTKQLGLGLPTTTEVALALELVVGPGEDGELVVYRDGEPVVVSSMGVVRGGVLVPVTDWEVS